MSFSEKLIDLRKRNGMSQEDLALKIPVSRQAVSRWESGYTIPDAENLIQLSRLFSVSVDYLLDNERNDSENFKIDETSISSKKGHEKVRLILGSLFTILGIVGVLIMGIMGSIQNNVVYGNTSLEDKRGVLAFLEIYNIEWLFVLCLIAAVIGIVVLIYPKIKRYIFTK